MAACACCVAAACCRSRACDEVRGASTTRIAKRRRSSCSGRACAARVRRAHSMSISVCMAVTSALARCAAGLPSSSWACMSTLRAQEHRREATSRPATQRRQRLTEPCARTERRRPVCCLAGAQGERGGLAAPCVCTSALCLHKVQGAAEVDLHQEFYKVQYKVRQGFFKPQAVAPRARTRQRRPRRQPRGRTPRACPARRPRPPRRPAAPPGGRRPRSWPARSRRGSRWTASAAMRSAGCGAGRGCARGGVQLCAALLVSPGVCRPGSRPGCEDPFMTAAAARDPAASM